MSRTAARLGFLLVACAAYGCLPAQTSGAGRAIQVRPAARGARLALVIGNDTYQTVGSLKNARADARAIAAGLAATGFQVTLKLDLDEKGMKDALRSFKASIQGGDVAVFYFSGHGVQLAGSNLLLPVDIRGGSEEQVRDEAIPLQRVLDDLQDQKAKFSLAIVDACRNNPFQGQGRAIGGRGLAPTTAATGQMVLFSAGSGQEALDRLGADDPDPNGLFTRIFLKEIRRPGVPVDQVLRKVREEVVRLSRGVGHEQVPALYDQALGEFFFLPGAHPEAGPASPPPPIALAMTGHLQVNVNAPGTKVYVDGVLMGEASPAAALNLEGLPLGRREVKAEAPGYGSTQLQVQVEAGQWVQTQVVLERAAQANPAPEASRTLVQFSTTLGDFTVELDADAAPKTVANFLDYVRTGFYRGTTFHRVVGKFMIQGGGFTDDGVEKRTQIPVENEAPRSFAKGWKNERGTLAMARAALPHGATAQFFVNLADNAFLNYPGTDGWGYCVFGRVVSGMDTVDRIQAVKTDPKNKPLEPVQIRLAVVAGGDRPRRR